MTNFLSRLIARSTGRAEVAHPVLAPLFATGPALASDSPSDGDVEGGRIAAPASPARPMAGRRRPLDAPTPALRPREAGSPLAATAAPPAVAAPRVTTAPVRRADDESSRDEGRPWSAERGPEERPTVRGRPRVVASARPTRARATPADGVEEPRSAAKAPRPRIEPRLAELRTGRPKIVDAGTIEGAPAPIIRVTIGRIEVRAVSPLAASRPVAPAARKDDRLSLEEYLKPLGRRR